TLYIPFNTYSSDDPSASMTSTGLAVTDIEIYKNGSVTQRASDAGYALKKISLVDQFPHTAHIETVALFEKN
ncbi:MAG: hypothetical protein NWP54_04330, partial [Polaribacter sp.]|nr:hypothetical protein [Polaribacter sp.]